MSKQRSSYEEDPLTSEVVFSISEVEKSTSEVSGAHNRATAVKAFFITSSRLFSRCSYATRVRMCARYSVKSCFLPSLPSPPEETLYAQSMKVKAHLSCCLHPYLLVFRRLICSGEGVKAKRTLSCRGRARGVVSAARKSNFRQVRRVLFSENFLCGQIILACTEKMPPCYCLSQKKVVLLHLER